MAMLDSLFKQRFNVAKCKTLLKLTIPRIKLLRNRREIQLKQMRRDIAKLLETGQEATARIRVEHIIREEKMMAAQEIVELFCELVSVRLPIIEAQRECPLDLKEAISSICFAAPRCADLPELLQAQILFAGKYGKEFVSAATELLPECGVNRQLIELLSIRAPAPDVKLNLLKEIAEEYQLDWDPSTSESQLLKPHEDLLFGSGSKSPLPEEKVDERPGKSEPATHEKSNSDDDFDIIDFPEVPKQPLQSNNGSVSAPEMLPFPPSAFSEVDDEEEPNHSQTNENLPHFEPGHSVQMQDASDKTSVGHMNDKQFMPFISPTSQSSESFSIKEHSSPPSISETKNYSVDLQDVLAAAQVAAESAERAAAAARSAASIAQLRISELVKNNYGVSGPTVENPFHVSKSKSDVSERADVVGDYGCPLTSSSHNNNNDDDDQNYPSYDDTEGNGGSSFHGDHGLSKDIDHHQPQRLPSMDDEMYFSYPKLFASQGSTNLSRDQSFSDSK